MIKLLLVFSLLLPVNCFAGSGIESDKVAHFGISYALQTASYGIFKQGLQMEKPCALAASVLFTMIVTTAKEMSDSSSDSGDIFANVLGVTAAYTTIVLFDF